MNVSNTSSISSAAADIALNPEGRLALMVLDHQQTQEDAARADKALARDRFIEASNEEVEAMRDKAGHIFMGALAQGGATLLASSFQVGDAWDGVENKVVKGGTDFGHGTAPVLGNIFGDSPAASDEADAKHAASLAEQARWQLDDANQVIDKADQAEDKAVDWLSSVNANQASAETGIIAGLA